MLIKNGVFTIEGSIPEPTIVNGNNKGSFYLEQKNMNVTLIKDKFKLEGSKTQMESEKLEKIRNVNSSKVRMLLKKREVINQTFLNDYNPTPIPKKILIDKDVKVVGVWVGYSKEIER